MGGSARCRRGVGTVEGGFCSRQAPRAGGRRVVLSGNEVAGGRVQRGSRFRGCPSHGVDVEAVDDTEPGLLVEGRERLSWCASLVQRQEVRVELAEHDVRFARVA